MITYNNAKNFFDYWSIGLSYEKRILIDDDFLFFSIGGSRQRNSFYDTRIPVRGIYKTNYNLSGSVGFIHTLLNSIDIVPKFLIINSFQNNEVDKATTDSRLVPIQFGFELGLRWRLTS